MPRTILCALTGQAGDRAALHTALLATKLFGAHLDCIHVHPEKADLVAMANATADLAVTARERLEDLSVEWNARTEKAHILFDRAMQNEGVPIIKTATAAKGPSAAWIEISSTNPTAATAEQARYRELVVLGRDGPNDFVGFDRHSSVLAASGRPMIIAPERPPQSLDATVMVAWKKTPEAARTVSLAAPYLERARRVIVLSVVEQEGEDQIVRESAESLAAQLSWHGTPAEAQIVAHDHRLPATALRDAAYELDAELIVMGAYSHSRLTEIVFGGMTHDLMSNCAVPLFLLH